MKKSTDPDRCRHSPGPHTDSHTNPHSNGSWSLGLHRHSLGQQEADLTIQKLLGKLQYKLSSYDRNYVLFPGCRICPTKYTATHKMKDLQGIKSKSSYFMHKTKKIRYILLCYMNNFNRYNIHKT